MVWEKGPVCALNRVPALCKPSIPDTATGSATKQAQTIKESKRARAVLKVL
jgi:hypothetical protein